MFSPAQVREHHCVELKDQEISQETKERFEKLKGESSQDIGHTNLVTMHVDTGDNPSYVKNLTPCLLSITAGFSRKKLRHWSVQESSKRASALRSAQ